MALFKRSWPNAIRPSGAVHISCDADRMWCKVCGDTTPFDQSDKSGPLPTVRVVMTSMSISEGSFCRAQSWGVLGVFVGMVNVSPTYLKQWRNPQSRERTCAPPCSSSGHLGIIPAFLFWRWLSEVPIWFHICTLYLYADSHRLNYRSLDHLLSCLQSPSHCANQAHGQGLWELP